MRAQDAPPPLHVGIIMDGNGRWARQRGKLRSQGHLEGLKAAKRVVKAASELGLKFLSLYTFSTENWSRSEREISYLMRLVKTHLKKEYDFYRDHRIRVVHSGDLQRLPQDVIKVIRSVGEQTAAHDGLILNLAINYGGRDEIVRAVNRFLASAGSGSRLTEAALRQNLDHPEIPDPDLVIRKGGEFRISNFLLWEIAYTELYYSATLWPDWGAEELAEAIKSFRSRDRRFGGVQ